MARNMKDNIQSSCSPNVYFYDAHICYICVWGLRYEK